MFDFNNADLPIDKKELYDLLEAQARGLCADETDPVANAANLSALLFNSLERVNWAGFYFLRGETLVVGPFYLSRALGLDAALVGLVIAWVTGRTLQPVEHTIGLGLQFRGGGRLDEIVERLVRLRLLRGHDLIPWCGGGEVQLYGSKLVVSVHEP